VEGKNGCRGNGCKFSLCTESQICKKQTLLGLGMLDTNLKDAKHRVTDQQDSAHREFDNDDFLTEEDIKMLDSFISDYHLPPTREYIYCVFCYSPKDLIIAKQIKERFCGQVIAPTVARKKWRRDQYKDIMYKLMPGYIFLRSDIEANVSDIMHIDGVKKFVFCGGNEFRTLDEQDMDFVNWVMKHDGRISLSKVKEVGDKVCFIDGPLVNYSGKIINVDKRKQRVCIQYTFNKSSFTSWLNYDVIDALS
jgi:transcription antitermination factor NusG